MKPSTDTSDGSRSPTPEEFEHAPHHQLLRPLSRESRDLDLEKFTSSHNLSHELPVFQKASHLLLHHYDSSTDIPGLTIEERTHLDNELAHKWRQPRLLYFTILVCSLGAIEQGWAQTAMNGANLYFPDQLGIGSDSPHDTFVVGFINCGIYLSVALWGSWLSEPLNNRFGRRGTIFIGSVLCLLGNLGSAMSWSWMALVVFRLVLGTGMGINAATVSVFAAECAPSTIRGGLAVSWQMYTAFGIFLGFVANVAFYNLGDSVIWRWQLAGPILPLVPLLALVYFCPESPAWYIKTGRYGLAYRSLARLRNTEVQAASELYIAYLQQQTRLRTSSASDLDTVAVRPSPSCSSYFTRIAELFTIPRIRHATLASMAVMLSQQLCGINIIAFYSATIFASAGFSALGALLASIIFGFVNFLGAFPAIWTMDTLGRRSLLLWTLPPMGLTMCLTGLVFLIPTGTVQFGLLATLVYLFCLLYSPGMGPVPVAYSAEVFPLTHREVGMSFAIAVANFFAALLSLTFPGFLAALGSLGSFELYAVLNIVALGLVIVFVRETKRKTLDELDEVFDISIATFVRFAVWEELPWLWRRCVRGRGDANESAPVVKGSEYRRLEQDEEDGYVVDTSEGRRY